MILKDAWLEFRKQVIAPDAPEIQLREMKMAFYGGASAMFFELAAASPEELHLIADELAEYKMQLLERATVAVKPRGVQ